jgi:hypothetical protein
MPQTRSRCFSERAIEAMRIDEVLEARMRLGRDHGFELAEQLLLDLEVLEHRLDDDVAALRSSSLSATRGWRRSWRDRRRSAALGDQALQRLEDRGLRLGRTAGAASNMTAFMPPCAVTCAMPRPMAPVPTTRHDKIASGSQREPF